MRILLAMWLPVTFTLVCIALLTVSLWFMVPAILGAGDARARHKEFASFKGRSLKAYMLSRMRYSMCQRNAAVAASKNMKYAAQYYHWLGYRWYHVLPDGTFSLKNNPYFKLKFYKKLLGV